MQLHGTLDQKFSGEVAAATTQNQLLDEVTYYLRCPGQFKRLMGAKANSVLPNIGVRKTERAYRAATKPPDPVARILQEFRLT